MPGRRSGEAHHAGSCGLGSQCAASVAERQAASNCPTSGAWIEPIRATRALEEDPMTPEALNQYGMPDEVIAILRDELGSELPPAVARAIQEGKLLASGSVVVSCRPGRVA